MHATPKSAIVTTVAIGLAKDVFELALADADARIIECGRLNRSAFAKAFDNRAPLRMAMEACGLAHDWVRRYQRAGHHVQLLPAQAARRAPLGRAVCSPPPSLAQRIEQKRRV